MRKTLIIICFFLLKSCDFSFDRKITVDEFINEELKILEFDYLGNSKQDLPIWEYTKKIIYTNISKDLRKIINYSKLSKYEIKEDFSDK